jgi:hypothetical protein
VRSAHTGAAADNGFDLALESRRAKRALLLLTSRPSATRSSSRQPTHIYRGCQGL